MAGREDQASIFSVQEDFLLTPARMTGLTFPAFNGPGPESAWVVLLREGKGRVLEGLLFHVLTFSHD